MLHAISRIYSVLCTATSNYQPASCKLYQSSEPMTGAEASRATGCDSANDRCMTAPYDGNCDDILWVRAGDGVTITLS
jgi:hypothetical protein